MRKTGFLILSLIVMILTSVNVYAEDMNISYKMRTDYKEAYDSSKNPQGYNGWYYQGNEGNDYKGYKDLTWYREGTVDASRVGKKNESNAFTNYVTVNGCIQSRAAMTTAIVWVASMSGTVKLGAEGPIYKQYNDYSGPLTVSPTTAKIVKTNHNYENEELLWTKVIEGGLNAEELAENNYEIYVEVEKGDKIFFEAKLSSSTLGETIWQPTVTYTQASKFSVEAMKDITNGSELKCEFYDNGSVDAPSKAYLAIYDTEGRFRGLSNDVNLSGSDGSKYCTLKKVFDFDEEDYNGWTARIWIITSESNRFWSMNPSKILFLD